MDRARRSWAKRGVGDVDVLEVRLCYFELGWNGKQRYLQPAYIVLATLFGSDRRIKTRDIYVMPAAVNHAGRIMVVAPSTTVAQPPAAGGRCLTDPTASRRMTAPTPDGGTGSQSEREVEANMRPGAFSRGGFLGSDENLRDVIAADSKRC